MMFGNKRTCSARKQMRLRRIGRRRRRRHHFAPAGWLSLISKETSKIREQETYKMSRCRASQRDMCLKPLFRRRWVKMLAQCVRASRALISKPSTRHNRLQDAHRKHQERGAANSKLSLRLFCSTDHLVQQLSNDK